MFVSFLFMSLAPPITITVSFFPRELISSFAKFVMISSHAPGITVPVTSKSFPRLLPISVAIPLAWLSPIITIFFFFDFAHHFFKFLVGVTLLVVLRLWDTSVTSCRLANGTYLFMMTGIGCSCCLISTSPLPDLRGDFFVLLRLVFINSSSV